MNRKPADSYEPYELFELPTGRHYWDKDDHLIGPIKDKIGIKAYQDLWDYHKTQLAAKNELLREAMEVVRAWESYLLYTTDEVIRCDAPEKLPGGLDSARGKAFMKLRKARTLLPKLEAEVKEQP